MRQAKHQRAQQQKQRRPGRQAAALFDAGHAIGAVGGAVRSSLLPAALPLAPTRRTSGMPSASQCTDPPLLRRASASRIAIGRAHVGDFFRIERPCRRDGGQRAVGQRDKVPARPPWPSRARCRVRSLRASASIVLPDGSVSVTGGGAAAMRAALDRDRRRRQSSADQTFLFELRLLHQPMRQTAQQVRLAVRRLQSRAPTARPDPKAVRRRGPCFTLVEHQQRLVARPAHHRLAGDLGRADQAEPAAPARRRGCRCWRRAGRASPDAPGPAA